MIDKVGQALLMAVGMFWQTGWSLVLGFAISALLQAIVPAGEMQRALGRGGIRQIALATFAGAASSSCSYASAAIMRTMFKKGAAFIASISFLFASTNLVIELGVILYLLLGWQFMVAEWIGGLVMIAIPSVLVTIAAVVYASGRYGPRLLSNFMSDRGNQVTLGTFIATFLYSLIVVRTIRSPGEQAGEAAFVPQLAVLVGVVLVLCSIAVLIYFIHHVPSRIHINSVIERIGDRLIAEIDNRFPVFVGQPLDERADDDRIPDAFGPDASPAALERRGGIRAKHTGYIQMIDEQALIDTAQDKGLVLRLQYQSGVSCTRAACWSRHGQPSNSTRIRAPRCAPPSRSDRAAPRCRICAS